MSSIELATTTQPRASLDMSATNPPPKDQGRQEQQHKHKSLASRLKGGGAGKDCLMSALACFVCCECCEGCLSCIGDIICCPCEMCC